MGDLRGAMTISLNDSTILLTGGTGSFGTKFVQMTLARHKPKKIIVYSRDEMKQWEMAKNFDNDPRLRFFLGDVRDKERLNRACCGVDYIVHAAALKIVPTAEYNPFECIKTNVVGAMNIIECAIDQRVKRVIALSTDKACSPVNLYGASKLCSDKLFIAGNVYVGNQNTRFAVVRYGNVMGSRGSVIPLFLSLAPSGVIPITDEKMTRFMITLEQGVELVWEAIGDCFGGEIYVKKIPSMKVIDIARTLAPNAKIRIVGIRPGEKVHEQMISIEDGRSTYEYEGHYKIIPQLTHLGDRLTRIEEIDSPLRSGRKCSGDFCYSSDTNSEWLSPRALLDWVRANFNSDRNLSRNSGESYVLQNGLIV